MPVCSMTGQGQGSASADIGSVACEIRSVNHRGLKLSVRTSEGLASLQPMVERRLKDRLVRGSIWVDIRWQSASESVTDAVDWTLVGNYVDRLQQLATDKNIQPHWELSGLLSVPGVINGGAKRGGIDAGLIDPIRALTTNAVDVACQELIDMRNREGASMVDVVVDELIAIERRAAQIASAAPEVVQRYEQRLTEKVTAAVQRHGLTVDAVDLVREVQVFADRSDINEELTRLRSHLTLFRETFRTPSSDGVGRKLEFIIQEINRETNTIGSKAGDAGIATDVVEIKCAVERIRELVLNLE